MLFRVEEKLADLSTPDWAAWYQGSVVFWQAYAACLKGDEVLDPTELANWVNEAGSAQCERLLEDFRKWRQSATEETSPSRITAIEARFEDLVRRILENAPRKEVEAAAPQIPPQYMDCNRAFTEN
jgi:hypothetical protein